MKKLFLVPFAIVILSLLLPYIQYKTLDDPNLIKYGGGIGHRANLKSRDELWESIRQASKSGDEYDLLVVGLGATGSGVMLDATLRGLNVLGVEMDDFSAGTSSRSTKLLHGGVRYLKKAIERFDMSQFKLVREALHQRWVMFNQAKHLTYSLRILTPIYHSTSTVKGYLEFIYQWIQLKMYDWLAYPHIHSSSFVSKSHLLESYPHINQDGLIGGVAYYDGGFNDAAFNLAVVLTSIQHGATAMNRVKLVSLGHDQNGHINEATVQNVETGEKLTVKTKMVVNAAGAFSDEVRKMDSPDSVPILTTSCGVHVVLDRKFCSTKGDGILITKTVDRRVMFLLPWQGRTLAGTTDSKCGVTNNPRPTEDEIVYIINHINKYFNQTTQLKRENVLSAWSGIRPLKKQTDEKDTASISREHAIYTSPSQLMSILGGKWTTYAAMATQIMDQVVEALEQRNAIDKSKLKPSDIENVHMVGDLEYNPDFAPELAQSYHISPESAEHVNELYGDQSFIVLEEGKAANLNQPLVDGSPVLESEVIYTIRYQYALHAVDFLERRTRIAMLDNAAALKSLDRVIELFAKELKWSENKQKEQKKIAKEHFTITS